MKCILLELNFVKFIYTRYAPTTSTVHAGLSAIMVGKHKTAKLNAEFNNDREKKAEGPQIRESEVDSAYKHGTMYNG